MTTGRFTAADITPELDYTLTPQPDMDVHWWRVDRGPDEKAGWVWVPASIPPPSREWIAGELSRLTPRLGAALDGRMRGPRGMQLDYAPRP